MGPWGLPQMADTAARVAHARGIPRLTVAALAPNLRGAQGTTAAGAAGTGLPAIAGVADPGAVGRIGDAILHDGAGGDGAGGTRQRPPYGQASPARPPAWTRDAPRHKPRPAARALPGRPGGVAGERASAPTA